MGSRIREWLRNAKFAYWIIVWGLVFFAFVIVLGMAEIITTRQILLMGQAYFFLLMIGMLLQMIARRV